MGLLERIDERRASSKGAEARSSIDTWISDYLIPSTFQFNGASYQYGGVPGLNQTLAGQRATEISRSLPGYTSAVLGCPPAFAAQMVRAMVLSQARFVFRNRPTSPTPRRTFGTQALSILERPWPRATAGELLARMEWHAGLAGNSFVVRQGKRLRVLRPDWVAVVWGSQLEPDDPGHALDGDLLGYVYWNGGPGRGEPRILLPDEMAHWCADEETEILTADGWKDYTTLRVGDEVLTLNHETGMSEWQPVDDVMVFPAQRREMVLMEGKEFSSLTTPNHRWPVEYRISRAKTYGRRWVTSATVGAGDRIPVAAYSADLPTDPKWTDALVELVAWFWTEGSYKSGKAPGSKGRGIWVAQSTKNADNLARIRAALTTLFGPAVDRMSNRGPRSEAAACWRESVDSRGPDHDMVIFSLSANAGDVVTPHAPGKVVTTGFLRSLTAAQLDLFVKVSLLADNNGVKRLGQKNPAMAEQFALACILAGHGVTIREGCTKKRGYRMTDVRMLRKRHVYPQESDRPGATFRVERVDYDGHVWCPRTPNQTWLARRRGSVYFTGNSPVPDPLSPGMGMSWLTPALRDVAGDEVMSKYKLAYFENGATANLVVKNLPSATPEQFMAAVDMLEDRHAGASNAYRTLYLAGGADATVIGSNLSEIDFKSVQGASETRISFLSRVPAPILGIAEGLAGSSLNAGNFGQSRRLFADTWVYPTLMDLCAALANVVDVPSDAELWWDAADIPLLREDEKDAAEITRIEASTIRQLLDTGFVPETVIAAVTRRDMTLLRHSGLMSVQLQKPGQPAPPGQAPAPAPTPPTDA